MNLSFNFFLILFFLFPNIISTQENESNQPDVLIPLNPTIKDGLFYEKLEVSTKSSSLSSFISRSIEKDEYDSNSTCVDFSSCSDKCECVDINNDGGDACKQIGFIDYLSFYYCTMSDVPVLALFLLLLWACILCYILISTAERYFCPALGRIYQDSRLSSNVAGVTLLAVGNGAPDLFSLFVAVQNDSDGIGVGALVGSTLFLITFVLAVVIILSPPIILTRKPFIRDLSVLLLIVILVFCIFFDGQVKLWETICLILGYLFYVSIVFLARWWSHRATRKRREAIGIIEDDDVLSSPSSLGELKDETEGDGYPMLDEVLFLNNLRSWQSTSGYFKAPAASELLFTDDLYDGDPDFEEMESIDGVRRFDSSSVDMDSNYNSGLTRGPFYYPKLIHAHCLSFFYRLWGLVNWSEKSVGQKIFFLFGFPLILARNLTIPKPQPWLPTFIILHPIFSPLFILLASKHFLVKLEVGSGSIPVWSILLIIGSLFSIYLYFTITDEPNPFFHRIFVVGAFVMSCVWMFTVATELLMVLRGFARIVDVSEQLIGLTLVAWSNSSVDLVSNIFVAKQYPNMAFSACFIAPTLNFILGLGLSYSFKIISSGGDSSADVDMTGHLVITFSLIMLSIVVTLLIVPYNKYTTTNRLSFFLLILYVCFCLVNGMEELGAFGNWDLESIS